MIKQYIFVQEPDMYPYVACVGETSEVYDAKHPMTVPDWVREQFPEQVIMEIEDRLRRCDLQPINCKDVYGASCTIYLDGNSIRWYHRYEKPGPYRNYYYKVGTLVDFFINYEPLILPIVRKANPLRLWIGFDEFRMRLWLINARSEDCIDRDLKYAPINWPDEASFLQWPEAILPEDKEEFEELLKEYEQKLIEVVHTHD